MSKTWPNEVHLGCPTGKDTRKKFISPSLKRATNPIDASLMLKAIMHKTSNN